MNKRLPQFKTSFDVKGAAHPRLYDLVKEMLRLSEEKVDGYTARHDKLSNYRASEPWVPAWITILNRIREKNSRTDIYLKLWKQGSVPDYKDVHEQALDQAILNLLMLIAYEEEHEAKG